MVGLLVRPSRSRRTCFFLFYLALLLVPCSDLLHVFSLMYEVKYACASVMLFSVIKLTRKLPNNLTYSRLVGAAWRLPTSLQFAGRGWRGLQRFTPAAIAHRSNGGGGARARGCSRKRGPHAAGLPQQHRPGSLRAMDDPPREHGMWGRMEHLRRRGGELL
jgi:hypothetical protein